MNEETGTLRYNCENDRFGILNMDLWINDGLHCGECLEVLINNRWHKDRLEMNRKGNWCLIKSGLEGNELEGLQVKL